MMDRREFLALLGGGLIVFVDEIEAQESGRSGRRGETPQTIGAWLHIAEDGVVSVYTGKAEVGQNTRTALTQAAAEELSLPASSVRLVMADTDRTPWDAGTFGSQSTPRMAPQLRRAAAAARERLLDLAAAKWHADRALLVVANGEISHPTNGETLGFGELTKGKKVVESIGDPKIARPKGEAVPKVNGRDFVTGRHQYSSDVALPGMLFGRVVRPPSFGAKLVTAEAPPGATFVREGDFAGVTAATPQEADRLAAAVRAEWKAAPQISQRELFDHLKKTATARAPNARGSVEEALKSAAVKLSATYTVAYIAHAPLEPRAAVAEWGEGKLTVWTGTQRPFGVRSELAQAFGLPEERVRVIVPDTGSAYGGKHSGEAAVEAARLAKAAGKPVKLVWTREEEFTWAYFRPAGVIEVSSGATRDGVLTAWEFINYNSGGSAIQPLYDIANQKVAFYPAQSPLKQGSYRALSATANHFARESHMDEIAAALKLDPVAFRLKNIKDGRLRGVLEAVAGKAPKNAGIACGFEKGSYVATAAQVAEANGGIRVERLIVAFDCGPVVNPAHLRNQVEGGVLMGLGGALSEAIEFENGRILNPRFSRYRVPRFRDIPEIETILIDRKDVSSAGAGETPIVCLAPAIANAVARATGRRLRSMPMSLRESAGAAA
jgi:isoquinoline 1-oxidoreductase